MNSTISNKKTDKRKDMQKLYLPLHLFVFLSKIAFVEVIVPYLQKHNVLETTHSPYVINKILVDNVLLDFNRKF